MLFIFYFKISVPVYDVYLCRYKEQVISGLDAMGQRLSELRPLNLRLEVMEDVFALLFATGDDVKQKSAAQVCEPPEQPENLTLVKRGQPSEILIAFYFMLVVY